MAKNLSSMVVAHLAVAEAIGASLHNGDMGWNQNHRRYATDCAPGEPGHGRPSVSRPKKAKKHGKNKKRK